MKQDFVEQISKSLSKVPIVGNLARKKFISLFILGLIKSRNIQFWEIAHHLHDKAKLSSNETVGRCRKIPGLFSRVGGRLFLSSRPASEPATQEGESAFMYWSNWVGFRVLSGEYSDDCGR